MSCTGCLIKNCSISILISLNIIKNKRTSNAYYQGQISSFISSVASYKLKVTIVALTGDCGVICYRALVFPAKQWLSSPPQIGAAFSS
jgi:hypothetical protein